MGRYRWGFVTNSEGRYGSLSTRLVIYPPGASRRDRSWAHLARVFPPVAIAVSILVGVALAVCGIPSLWAYGVPAVIMALAWVALAVKSSSLRRRSVEVLAWTSAISPDAADFDDRERIETFVRSLAAAERALNDRGIDRAVYDNIWTAVYETARAAASTRVPRR